MKNLRSERKISVMGIVNITGDSYFADSRCLGPDGKPLISIAKQLRDKGYAIGIITSGQIDDATPAAFYASQKRKETYLIGKEGADSVLRPAVVNTGLAAESCVDSGEKRRWDEDAPCPPHVHGSGECRHIQDHATA